MAGRVQHDQSAVADVILHVQADLNGRDDVLAALQDQGGVRHLGQIGAVIGGEGDALCWMPDK